jgi:fumarylpyruvate hydrolase
MKPMSDYVFPPPSIPSVAVHGRGERFPVRRIFCVGRNYADHAREMGKDPDREPPFFFTKPADAVVDDDTTVPYPPLTKNLHHEVEAVVAIGTDGSDIAPADAGRHVFGYGVGVDLTRRDLQAQARDMGRPWDWAKAFDHSAPCGPLLPADGSTVLEKGSVSLHVNGELRQTGDISDMIWGIADIVALCSRSMRLKRGDLIFTGTPAGVGAVNVGDTLVGRVDGLPSLAIRIGAVAAS